MSNGRVKWAENINAQLLLMPSTAATDLDGRFAGDVGDQEVHSDVLAVDVLVHHVPDGLGHHVRVQVGVVLQQHEHSVSFPGRRETPGGVLRRTLWKKAAPVRTMDSSQE